MSVATTSGPAVALVRPGERYQVRRFDDDLGGSSSSPALLLTGSQGLGVAPVDVKTTERAAGHGSVLRGVRLKERQIFVPVLLEADTYTGLNDARERLEDAVDPLRDGVLELEVTADGRDPRSIPVVYEGGLEGDYGSDYWGSWQTLGLQFRAVDAFWSGPEVVIERGVSQATAPFLSGTAPFLSATKSFLASSNVVGELEFFVPGKVAVAPRIDVVGPGTDLIVADPSTGARFFLAGPITEPVTIDMQSGDVRSPSNQSGELFDRVSTDSSLAMQLQPGHNTLNVSMVSATGSSSISFRFRPKWKAGH